LLASSHHFSLFLPSTNSKFNARSSRWSLFLLLFKYHPFCFSTGRDTHTRTHTNTGPENGEEDRRHSCFSFSRRD
jgi:hypothetical protein